MTKLWGLLLFLLPLSTARAQADRVILLPQDSARHLTRSYSEGPAEQMNAVLRTAAEWDSVWDLAQRSQAQPSALAAPAVDFTQEMVLLAAAGRSATPGWSIRIDTVVTRTDTLRVIIHAVAPRCLAGMTITYPWDAVRVARNDNVVQFIRRPVVDWCR